MAKTIALIDDSAVMRAILRKSILMANRDVGEFVEASNGKEGFELIKNKGADFDLIITDIDMPEWSGVQMMKKIRETGLKTAPIVVITTVGNSGMRETCRALGAVGFLNKPFSAEEIKGLLERVL